MATISAPAGGLPPSAAATAVLSATPARLRGPRPLFSRPRQASPGGGEEAARVVPACIPMRGGQNREQRTSSGSPSKAL